MNAMPHGVGIHPRLFFFTARSEWRSADFFFEWAISALVLACAGGRRWLSIRKPRMRRRRSTI